MEQKSNPPLDSDLSKSGIGRIKVLCPLGPGCHLGLHYPPQVQLFQLIYLPEVVEGVVWPVLVTYTPILGDHADLTTFLLSGCHKQVSSLSDRPVALMTGGFNTLVIFMELSI